jgi:predicted nucleic acid-binding protein
MTLVDTNVLADILSADPAWLDWSVEALDRQASLGPLLINEAVYAELAVRMPSQDRLDAALATLRVEFVATPRAALFLAGKAFGRYRRAGGQRTGVLPDFYIGAHAAVARLPLLTRDAGRYRTYFPRVRLIAPA